MEVSEVTGQHRYRFVSCIALARTDWLTCLFQGTTLMTYPRYPTFEPHTILDWQSYDLAVDSLAFTSEAPQPFMRAMREAMGGWMR